MDSWITEWLANEEASLEEVPMNFFDNQQDIAMFRPSKELEYSDLAAINTLSNRHSRNKGAQPTMQCNRPLPVLGNTELRPTNEIPKPFGSIFKFGVFNIIQSKCLDDTFYENNNLVISAPTGSGKTALMELAIIRTLLNQGNDTKIIYMAPTKSLCSERTQDWGSKFGPFGIECKEFTGDTQFYSTSAIQNASIIITTPEKWDSMTRRWIDNRQLMQLISLFLIDEVHILNENRGACLEACVSRMQTMDINLRYIAVSATIPNLQDIATWLRAKPISFSEEYRPIKLERIVYGYPQDCNMFLFEKKLDWKLLDIIIKHSNTKPVLIFCSTRKSAEGSCDTLLKMMDKKNISSLCENGKKLVVKPKFKNKLLPGFGERGIGFHHAGLDPSDRSQMEKLYLKREIRVIGALFMLATTSTLAVGVNLPAHLVIIKSTQGYQNGTLSEYTDIDTLQMIGRAGRPGLDTSGTIVIMTTSQMETRYRSLIAGGTNLESRLHENLIEHLLSEICLSTITNMSTALTWLQSTFLYVRLSKNPTHYKLNRTENMSIDVILKEICVKDLELLERHNLIEKQSNFLLKPTPYGLIMDKYYVKFLTMIKIMEAENPTSVKDTLNLISECQQEMNTIRFNSGDRQFLSKLKNNPNIRFPLDKIVNVSDKICLLVQCVLGDIPLNNVGSALLVMEATTVMKDVCRIVKCLIDCSVQEKSSTKLRFALELYQSIQAKIWSTSPYVSRQIEGIGPQFSKTLSQANLITMEQLKGCDPGRFEVILHRNPPFGTKVN
ncbi:hypothetical protein INT47_004087 [Mucor saturninus]|uniref:DNA 3'-5' helicase n=1 Tax=Mucor saturninus TaxID=64648 RepID=A0A8H7R5H4_9FUNG|nr:hypothetical protein INT47_004087 [Mucor saturninus]